MTNETFDRAINDIRTNLIEEAAQITPRIKPVSRYAAAVFAVFAIGGLAAVHNLSKAPLTDDKTPSLNSFDREAVDNGSANGELPPPVDEKIVVNQTETAPEILLPCLRAEICTDMSSEEMFEYYGLDLTSLLCSIEPFHEIEGSYPHGLYTFTDGVFDMNHFVYLSEDGLREIEIYIGKKSKCGRLANGFDMDDCASSTVNGTELYIFQYENSPDICLYAEFEKNGCSFMVLENNVAEPEFLSVLEKLTGD